MVWISRFRATEESLGSGVLWEASNDGRTQPTNNATTGNLQLNFINWVRIWKAKYALFFGQALSFSWMKSTNQTCFLCFEGVSWLFNPLLLFLFVHLFTNLSSVFVSVQITDQVDVYINWSPWGSSEPSRKSDNILNSCNVFYMSCAIVLLISIQHPSDRLFK